MPYPDRLLAQTKLDCIRAATKSINEVTKSIEYSANQVSRARKYRTFPPSCLDREIDKILDQLIKIRENAF